MISHCSSSLLVPLRSANCAPATAYFGAFYFANFITSPPPEFVQYAIEVSLGQALDKRYWRGFRTTPR